MSTYKEIPRQKLPFSKKGKKWRESCVEAYINLSNIGGYNGGFTSRRDDLKRLYDFYNGVIEDTEYEYVLKPYGKTRKNFPSKMRNYPIIKPIIDLLLGEKTKRPFNYTVSVTNADTISEKEKARSELVLMSLQQQFVNKMNEGGMDTGVPSQEAEMPQHIVELFNKSYVDNRASMGQHAMNYILQQQEVHDKLQKAWFHFLVSGEVFTERGVRNDEPFYDIINPMNVDYDLDPDLEFVEDGDWAVVRRYSHASTLIDKYHQYLNDAQINQLEEPDQHNADSWMMHKSHTPDKDPWRSKLIEAITVYWKSRRRVGFLQYMDPNTGQLEEIEVPDGFKMPAELKQQGAMLTWLWVNEVWEGTRIDGDIYININPVINQRGSIDNPSKCKLPINGRRYSDINASNISLVSLGIPYQLNYNIYKYRLELAIARSKDIIAQFDINMIPKKWDMDKFMYYVEGTGIAWVDYNKEGIQLSPQHQSVLDMSIKTIEQYIVLLNAIMEEWEKLSGVNRQRQGQVGSYEGKATSQQAIVQSSHITEDMFRKFGRMEQRDLQAMLDYSKEAWLTGKKSMYVMPDGTTDFLDLDTLMHMEAEYGIFVSDSGAEQDKLMQARQLSQAMIQNGVPASTVLDMMEAGSFTQLKDKIAKAEKTVQELEAQQQQAQQQMQEQALAAKAEEQAKEFENDDKDRQNKMTIAELQADTQIKIAELKADVDLQELDALRQANDNKHVVEKEKISEQRRTSQAKESTDRSKAENDKAKVDVQRAANKDKRATDKAKIEVEKTKAKSQNSKPK